MHQEYFEFDTIRLSMYEHDVFWLPDTYFTDKVLDDLLRPSAILL